MKHGIVDSQKVPLRNASSEISSDSADEAEEAEPPGCTNTSLSPMLYRHPFYMHVPDELWNNWKWQFQNRVTTIDELKKFIPLDDIETAALQKTALRYPLSVTPYYLSLINPADPQDPVRLQCVPSSLETCLSLDGYDDPLDEIGDSAVPGLVHRYQDRALIVTTNICPVFCRHCTRKRDWNQKGMIRNRHEFEEMFEYIKSNPQIRDVIISGGDPLSLSNARLEWILRSLRSIEHIEIIRIGSRFPVVLPQRIDDDLCEMLSRYSPIWFNTHFNNVWEITPESAAACDRLLRHGIPLNNQSVLLKGVNDTVKDQLALCQGLLKIKVRPYYLFQCDEVRGTEHLRTPVEKGVEIIAGMRGHTSGMGIPTFVVDLPNGGGKVPLLPQYVLAIEHQTVLFKNYQGDVYSYRNPNQDIKRPSQDLPVSKEVPTGVVYHGVEA